MNVWIIAIVLGLSPYGKAADEPDSQVFKLLAESKNLAVEVNGDISTLDFIAGSTYDWERHASIVAAYREHVQAIRELAAKLDDARSSASPAEKTALEPIAPLLRELASVAGATIENADKKMDRLDAKDRRDYLKVCSALTNELAGAIGNLVEYAKMTRERDVLTAKFGLSSP